MDLSQEIANKTETLLNLARVYSPSISKEEINKHLKHGCLEYFSMVVGREPETTEEIIDAEQMQSLCNDIRESYCKFSDVDDTAESINYPVANDDLIELRNGIIRNIILQDAINKQDQKRKDIEGYENKRKDIIETYLGQPELMKQKLSEWESNGYDFDNDPENKYEPTKEEFFKDMTDKEVLSYLNETTISV